VFERCYNKRQYTFFFWLNSSTETSLNLGLIEIARELSLIDDAEVNIDNTYKRLLHVLNMQDSWFMVLYNVDKVSLIKKILPRRRTGQRHVLITTRYRQVLDLDAWKIDLEPLQIEEAKAASTNLPLFERFATDKRSRK